MSERHEATFFWPYVGPHNVSVKGSFDNWTSTIPLTRTTNGFEAHVPVEWGKDVQYKYIVDGVWATAADKPTTYDSSGNVNNVYHAPLAPAKVEETRVVTTSDLPPAHPEVLPAPPADAISPSPDPMPEKPVPDEPKPTTLEKIKDTVISSEGASSSPISYAASGMGAAIQVVTGVDPINPPQLPVDVHTHSPIRFSRKSDDLSPSPAAPAIVTPPLVDAVTKPVVAVPDTLDSVKTLSNSPIVEAVTKPIVAVPPEPAPEQAPIVAAPVVPEVKVAEEPPKEPEVPKPAEEPPKEPEAPKPVEEPPYVPEPPKPVEEAPRVPEVPKPAEEPPKVPEAPKPAEEPQVPEPPKIVEPAKVPEVPQEPEVKVVVDPPAPATPKAPPAPIDVPPADATFPTIPSPKKPEPATPTKPSRNSETNGTLASVKSRESVSKSPFGTKRGSFLGRQSSDASSPSKISVGSGKERKRKSSFFGKIKHIFSHDDKDKEKTKDGIKEKK